MKYNTKYNMIACQYKYQCFKSKIDCGLLSELSGSEN